MNFLWNCLRRLRRRRKICLRQSILCLDLCAAAPGRSFACAGDLPQSQHGFHPGLFGEYLVQLGSTISQYHKIFHPYSYHRKKSKSTVSPSSGAGEGLGVGSESTDFTGAIHHHSVSYLFIFREFNSRFPVHIPRNHIQAS